MRTFITAFALLAALFAGAVFSAAPALALEPPALQGRVTDLADMISPAMEQRLTSYLAELEKTDGTQVAILTIPSLEGDSLEDFSLRVAHDAWKLGQEKEDNGVLLLVSKEDRKLRIEVGYGLEGVLTDVLSGSIIDQVITPRFKAGDFDGGIAAGTQAIAQAVRGEYVAPQKSKRESHGIGSLLPLILFVFVGAHLLTPARGRVVETKDGKKVVRGSGLGILPWLLIGSSLGGHHRGGGGFGGGGFGGGGFGGGGGGFGGGGASGGW